MKKPTLGTYMAVYLGFLAGGLFFVILMLSFAIQAANSGVGIVILNFNRFGELWLEIGMFAVLAILYSSLIVHGVIKWTTWSLTLWSEV